MDKARAGVRALERLGLAERAEPTGRAAFRRLEAAAGARRVHDSPAASCCCSTSRPPASTRRRAANSGRRSTGSPREGIDVLIATHYMDEAERCHRLAFILDGRLLAHGTVPR